MHSIRTKITALTIVGILVSVIAIGGIGIQTIRRLGDQSSEKEMTLLCQNLKRSVDQYLNSVEQSVDMIARYASDELDIIALVEGGVIGSDGTGNSLGRTSWNTPQQRELDQYLQTYGSRIEEVFGSLANHTNGVISYYYRINQELTNEVPSQGFLYSKGDGHSFVKVQVTDISLYEPDDVAHVGWYYIPLSHGRPTWMIPYYNDNLGVKMFSYVCPIYKAGTFIGVIGMDISYQTLVSQLQDAQLFQGGFASLIDENGTIIYHPNVPSGSSLEELELDVDDRTALHFEQAESDQLITYTSNGTKRKAAFTTLTNGFKLVVSVPSSEINANWTRLVNRIVLASIALLTVFAAFAAFTMKRITEPLQRLTAASRLISAGNYDIELKYHDDDEVGVLTASFQQLVDHLKIYIADLNSKAYSDALTGVKNKGAFDISAHKLNDQIRMSDANSIPRFAIVMLDCNNLKTINDDYGHEKGDVYLRSACSLICSVFKHSPVFRMGGDEFVVLLQKEDYEHRDKLIQTFRSRAGEITRQAVHPWEGVSIALGIAIFHPKVDSTVESVLKRADEHMYLNKKELKAGR